MKNTKKKLMDPMLLSKRNAQILMDAQMTGSQMGNFVLALLGYQAEGKLPENMDPVSLALWKVVRADMKREFGERVR